MRTAISALQALPLLLFGAACTDGLPANATVRDGGPRQVGDCVYPSDAIEPMTEGEVLWPYRWANAIDLETGPRSFDFAEARCETNTSFELFLLVSAPAT